jgi:protein-tyrosine kinase
MSNSIEKAAQRLEQLRQAGAQMPAASTAAPSVAPVAPVAPVASVTSVEPPVAPRRPAVSTPVGSRFVNLDFERLTAAGFVTPTAPRSMVADQFRVIKRPLIDNATGKGASVVRSGNLIMVTSSMPGEGKSFTAVNLALSMAMEMDHTVMLVDADVARPLHHEGAGFASWTGSVGHAG